MGAKGTNITHNTLRAIQDEVRERVQEEIHDFTASSGTLEQQGGPMYVTQNEMELAMMKKCEECQAEGGPLGKVTSKIEELTNKIGEWCGERRANTRWIGVTVTLSAVLIGAVLTYGFGRISSMQEHQAQMQTAIAGKVAELLRQVQPKGQP